MMVSRPAQLARGKRRRRQWWWRRRRALRCLIVCARGVDVRVFVRSFSSAPRGCLFTPDMPRAGLRPRVCAEDDDGSQEDYSEDDDGNSDSSYDMFD